MCRSIVSFLALPLALLAYPNGSRVPPGNAGEPGTGTPCASCHTVTLQPASGSVRLSAAVPFTPGVAQRWTITVADANASWRKGFQLTTTAGTLAAVTAATVTTAPNGRSYANHSTSAASYVVDWTPPMGLDTVTVYLAGAAASGTRQTNVYTLSFPLPRAAAGPRPAIGSAGAVNAASFAPGISPGSWVTIFGTNLAPSGVARAWTAAEIVDGKLPTRLEGTSVRINGRPAALAWVSETQLNVQAPDDPALGPVALEVETAAGVSEPAIVQLGAASPGLFRFGPDANRHVAAVHADGVLAGPAELFGPATPIRPAAPGETILLFGTGFGPTSPSVPAGSAFSGAAPLAPGHGLVVRIGGQPAEVPFAGLGGAGLNQLNVVVPALPDGEHLVEVTVLGVSVPSRQFLAVRR